ncbi:hypothetical protein WMF04_34185 [Sorangium sp. So ce260]|uniref:hypothetical protein n=1 Tax=Sorangium sp. So ce260 TaxID=3133291 RepID=UPI003F62BC1D
MVLDLEAYATVMAQLAASSGAQEDVLARHGLGEARWDAADTYWQARLSEAVADESDGVPALLAAYSAAYQAAQRAAAPPISLEQFAGVTRLLQSTGDVHAALAKVGVTLADYVRASEHWSRRMAQDPEPERRFREAIRCEAEESPISS